MKHLKIKTEERINHILLDREKSNAMDVKMVEELTEIIKQSENDEAIEGIVLHGKEGFFSAGLDLIELYNYNEDQALDFWYKFLELVETLAAFCKPSVAAISGHSPAGGCVLALCCDYRIMAKGDYIIGLNEIPVGIIIPNGIFDLYSFWIGKAQAYRNLLEGKLLSPEEALDIGLIDEIVEANKIQTAAFQKIRQYTQYEKNAWRASKINLRQDLLMKLNEKKDQNIEQILKQWWKPSTRSIIKSIIDNLTAKKE